MSKYTRPLTILPCLVLLLSSAVEAQYFDSLIFKTYGYYWEESIIYMGDQNDDGFDDFLVCAMDSITGPYGKARFFYGGNPMDTIPEFTIPFYTPKSITACDINRDGYRDIVSMRLKPIFPVWQKPHPILHPTWELMHKVTLPSAGMITISKSCPSAVLRRTFWL